MTPAPVGPSMSYTLVAPATVDEALALARPGSGGTTQILAGGTDLVRDLDDGRADATLVVSLRRLPWKGIAWDGASVTIGSTRSLRQLELDADLRARLPGLHEAIQAVGGVALRHRATLGGNVARASPASDLLPILLAYDARARLVSAAGARSVPVDELLVGTRNTTLAPGELIESLTIPRSGPSAYVWQRVRPANDISQVGLAVARAGDPPTWRVALGGVAPRPVRLGSVERRLGTGRPTTARIDEAGRDAADHAPFVTDKRATEEYRRFLVTALFRRAAELVVARAGPGAFA